MPGLEAAAPPQYLEAIGKGAEHAPAQGLSTITRPLSN
jgi:hypothetical protein